MQVLRRGADPGRRPRARRADRHHRRLAARDLHKVLPLRQGTVRHTGAGRQALGASLSCSPCWLRCALRAGAGGDGQFACFIFNGVALRWFVCPRPSSARRTSSTNSRKRRSTPLALIWSSLRWVAATDPSTPGCLTVCMCACVSVSVCLSVSQSVSQSASHPSVSHSAGLSGFLSIQPSVGVSLSVCLSFLPASV